MTALVIRGARDNNLADVDLDLPLGALIVLCGPSGSGKSSLAFDTLHREGQRRVLEAMLVGRGALRRPDVGAITGLPPTIALDQRERAAAAHETVAGLSELAVGLAVLFGRTGTAHCPSCGRPVRPLPHDGIVAEILGLPPESRLVLEAPTRPGDGVLDEIARAGFSRVRADGRIQRVEDVRGVPSELRVVVDRIKVSPDKRSRIADGVRLAGRVGRGVLIGTLEPDGTEQVWVDRPVCVHDGVELPPNEPGRFRVRAGEPDLGLDRAAAVVEVGGRTLPDVMGGTIREVGAWLGSVSRDPVSETVIDDLARRVGVLEALGLGGLRADRAVSDASRGETLRLRLARQVSSQLSGVLYVFDEPAAGLDEESARAVLGVLRELVTQGNTVIAVDHHRALVEAADHVVEFGPGAGPHGGRVVFEGPPDALARGTTATGDLLAGRLVPVRASGAGGRPGSLGGLAVREGGITVITGPSGGGKTRALAALRQDGQDAHDRVVQADAGSLARARRSTPATFTGLWTALRELLAQTREARVQGFSAATFSLNTKGGRCETCAGAGEVRVALDPLPDVWMRCPVCHGRRFEADVLQVTWKGHAPDELLALSVDDAHAVLAGHPKLERVLRALRDTGLGYVQLGRGTDTLSGGEMRRLQLARELARASGAGLIVADDPSLGLHPADTVLLMRAFARLAEDGATVVLASADPFVVGAAHQVVDVSP